MGQWKFKPYKYPNGLHTVRETFYNDIGQVCLHSTHDSKPCGENLDELITNLEQMLEGAKSAKVSKLSDVLFDDMDFGSLELGDIDPEDPDWVTMEELDKLLDDMLEPEKKTILQKIKGFFRKKPKI